MSHTTLYFLLFSTIVSATLYYLTDKFLYFHNHPPKIWFRTLHEFFRQCLIYIFTLFFAEFLLNSSKNISLYSYWSRIPYNRILLLFCVIALLRKSYCTELLLINQASIEQTKYKEKNPTLNLTYYQIYYQSRKEQCSLKLSLLKNFSPIPIVLIP